MRLKNYIASSIDRSAQYTKNNILAIGLVGFVGFPLYYFVWEYIFPQPYENFLLRIIGCSLFFPFVIVKLWPERLIMYFPAYWLAVFIYALPFFFTFMLLMNDASAVWGMSTMSAILLLFLIIDDWVLINIMFLIGSFLGWLVFVMNKGSFIFPHNYLEQLPVYIFALFAGSIFNRKAEIIRQERMKVMMSVGSNIAHELRTPLLGIRSGISGLRKYLPNLLKTHQIAIEHDLVIPKIRKTHISSLESLLDRIEDETIFSNNIIDMLLVNAGNIKIDKSTFKQYSMKTCVETAVKRYPFASDAEMNNVCIDIENDFYFFGSDILYTHMIFNLINNSLYFIHKAGRGEITISVKSSDTYDTVVFRDTGTGINPSDMPYIFNQFYSTKGVVQGTGLGLPFCKVIMESFEGRIYARSVLDQYSEIIMEFERR